MAREMTIATAAAAVGVALASAVGASAATAVPVGTICVAESYSWVGQASLDPGETFDTGISVPAEPGAQLAVRAVDFSTDVVGSPVAISVGLQPVSSGAAIAGGSIAATNGGQAAFMVTSVALNIDRCHQVEQAPPEPGLVVTGPATATAVAGGVESPPAPAVPAVPAGPTDGLPNTGSASAGLVWGAAASLAFGSALVAISRRRALAG